MSWKLFFQFVFTFGDSNLDIIKYSLFLLISSFVCIQWHSTSTMRPIKSCIFYTHPWWRHQMETFSALLAICASPGIHRSPVNSAHKGQWRGALVFSLICVWINGWVNNREAGDLRRYRAHYDVFVLIPRDSLLYLPPLRIDSYRYAVSFIQLIRYLKYIGWFLYPRVDAIKCSSIVV